MEKTNPFLLNLITYALTLTHRQTVTFKKNIPNTLESYLDVGNNYIRRAVPYGCYLG